MAYTVVPQVFIGNLWDAADFNKYYNDNFDAGTGKVTTKGDLLVATSARNAARLGVGTDGAVLVADSNESTGIKWEKGGNIQTGMIIIWSGSTGDIPSGWVICDGNNSTPDLRNRFVVGAGSTYAVGATGGSTTLDISHSHTMAGVASKPGHFHFVNVNIENAHTHAFSNATSGSGGVSDEAKTFYQYNEQFPSAPSHTHDWNGNSPAPNANHTHSVAVSTSSSHSHTLTTAASSNASMATIPTYYALAYIMKVAS